MADLSAVDLIDSGRCSASCLLAAGPSKNCGCCCGEKYHGALRLVDPAVREVRQRWWDVQSVLPSYLQQVLTSPTVKAQMAAFRRRKDTGEPVAWVAGSGRHFGLYLEFPRMARGFTEEQVEFLSGMRDVIVQRLCSEAGRSASIYSSVSLTGFMISPFPSRDAATIVGQAVLECYDDNRDGCAILIASAANEDTAVTSCGTVRLDELMSA